MDYVITDGERFIYRNRSGRYIPTRGQMMADTFTKKQAEAIYRNSLSKALKLVFRVEPISPDNKTEESVGQDQMIKKENDDQKYNIQYWVDKASNLDIFSTETAERRSVLTKQLNDVEKELCDLLHYCEFYTLNASQGYKAYKMIKERRIKRRLIKDELQIVDCINDKKIGDSVLKDVNAVIKKMNKRTYEPRALKELFDR